MAPRPARVPSRAADPAGTRPGGQRRAGRMHPLVPRRAPGVHHPLAARLAPDLDGGADVLVPLEALGCLRQPSIGSLP